MSYLYYLFIVVPNHYCTILWGPAILGRAGARQRSRSRTHPGKGVYIGKAG